MKLRVCSVYCNKNIKVQISSNVKTLKSGTNLNLIELGTIVSYGRDHWVGISSDQIDDVGKVKKYISNLEEYPPEARVKWFEQNFPRVDIYHIESSQMGDRLGVTKNTIDQSPVVISSCFELKWKG